MSTTVRSLIERIRFVASSVAIEEVVTGVANYKVTKMRFPSKTDKSNIIYNDRLTLAGIPSEAYRYVVNGRGAIEWIMSVTRFNAQGQRHCKLSE